MKEFKKTCKYHGKLSSENIKKHKRKYGYDLECRICCIERNRRIFKEYKEKLKSGHYENSIPEKICKIHGKLHVDNITGRGIYMRCKLCQKIINTGDLRNKCESRVLRKRKISKSQYHDMFEKQQHKCAICKKVSGLPISKCQDNETPLFLDHDHISGAVRALLCRHCNYLIANCKENIEILESAIDYLKRFQVVE